jgi:pSer/pThr/pTyr-binding forkhead associated (FHA) protein
MPYLRLMYGNKLIDQYAIEYGSPLTIGRKETNHIVINNLAVSGVHARIEATRDGIFLTDLESKNGTFVNGKTTIRCQLNEGDEIVVGKHKMIYTEAEGGKRVSTITPTIAPAAASLDETMVLDTSKHRDMISNILTGAASGAGATVKRKTPIPVLLYMKGGTGKVVLRQKFTRIGKEPANDIVIKGLFIGGRAATVTKRNDGYYVAHMNGLAKTRVNGKKIKTAQKLEHGDILSVGKLKMKFLSKPKKTT